MKNGKFSNRRRGVSTKVLVLTLTLVLVIGCSIGGTLAWLTAETGPVTNTFTTSDVDITLTESAVDRTFQMIPGYTIDKDPKVTVKAGSEKCYVFVKIDESNWPTPMEEIDGKTVRKVNYEIDGDWTPLDEVPGVYYLIQDAVAEDEVNLPVYSVLENDQVTVSGNLTKQEMGQISPNPTLTFTAYACQYMKDNNTPFTPLEAWNNCPKT